MSEYIKVYSEFLKELSLDFLDNDIILTLESESDDKKYNRGYNLAESLNTETHFNYFTKTKIKLFSHKNTDTLKISESLFGKDLTLKKIFNNKDEPQKTNYWNYLHKLVLFIKQDQYAKDNTNTILKNQIDKLKINNTINNTKEYINKIFDTSKLSSSTNEMIDDIINSFQKTFSENSQNPIEGIMKINELIVDKYKDKIESGEVNLNEIIDRVKETIPGIDNILKSFMTDQGNNKTVVMDENFSTADVPVGEQNESTNPLSNIKLGSILKTMNTLGINSNGEMPDMSKVMGLLKDNNIDFDKIQNQVSNLLSTNNIDVSKMTEQVSDMFCSGKIDMPNISELLNNNNIDVKKITAQMGELLNDNNIDVSKIKSSVNELLADNNIDVNKLEDKVNELLLNNLGNETMD